METFRLSAKLAILHSLFLLFMYSSTSLAYVQLGHTRFTPVDNRRTLKSIVINRPIRSTTVGSTVGSALGSTVGSSVGSNASSPTERGSLSMSFPVNLKNKVAFVAGIGDSSGYGWSIAKHLSLAGATVVVGTWPPVYNIFTKSLKAGKFEDDMRGEGGSVMKIDKVYPFDAVYDKPEDVPEEVKNNKRYANLDGGGGFTISEVAEAIAKDYGKVDILVHSLANGPEVTRPLMKTTRNGYLAAVSASSYSLIGMLQAFAPIMNPGGSALSLTYIASEKVIPGYGGGMSSSKSALESDTRTLAFECGRNYGIRVNTISAGPLKSRAASAIGNDGKKSFIEYAIDYSKANAPLPQDLQSDDVGRAGLFLLSPLSNAITGVTLYVDNGLHAMGQSLDSPALGSKA